MVKYIYYFLSVFNVLLAFLIITNFSDFALNPQILEIMKKSLELLIPVMILETINIFIEDLGLTFKNIIKRIIDWVYEKDNIIPNKTPKKSKDGEEILNPFSYSNIDMEDFDYHYSEEYDKTEISWKTVLFFTVAAIGVSYYFYPDLYHGVFQGLKDKFFPPRGPSGGGLGDPSTSVSIPVSVKGKGVEFVNVGYVGDLTLLQNKVNDIVHSPNLPIEDKLEVLGSFKRSLNMKVTDVNFVKKLDIFSEAKNYLHSQIKVENIPSTSTPSIASTSTFIPDYIITSTSSSNPTSFVTPPSPNVSTGSLTPTNNSGYFTPTNSSTGSLTPTVSNPKLALTILTEAPVLPISTEMVRVDHSPVLEAIPKDVWDSFKKGSGLTNILNPNLSPSDYPVTFDWPVGHISPYESGTATPVDSSAPKMIMDKWMEEINKK